MSENKNKYTVLLNVDFVNPVYRRRNIVEYRTKVYNGKYLQVRQYSKKVMFYEMDKDTNKGSPIKKETVEWLVQKKRFSKEDRKKLKKYL